MRVDIYIREIGGDREIRVPLLPEEIEWSGGETTFVSSDIMRRGEVAFPSGTELASCSWKSEFPGQLRKTDPMIRGNWKEPKWFDNILEDWKSKGTKLNVLVVGYPFNKDVYIKAYRAKATGAFGDIEYEIEFVEARSITIKTTIVEKEPERPAATSKTYVIKSGDTLWGISTKFYGKGTKWKTIYEANKEIIEKTATARWKAAGINRDSQNGHWIFPGVTLTIPDV